MIDNRISATLSKEDLDAVLCPAMKWAFGVCAQQPQEAARLLRVALEDVVTHPAMLRCAL